MLGFDNPSFVWKRKGNKLARTKDKLQQKINYGASEVQYSMSRT